MMCQCIHFWIIFRCQRGLVTGPVGSLMLQSDSVTCMNICTFLLLLMSNQLLSFIIQNTNLAECLGHLMALTLTGKIVQTFGMEHLKAKKNNTSINLEAISDYHTLLACFLWVYRNIEQPQYTEPVAIQI